MTKQKRGGAGKSLASQINTDWIPANRKLSASLAAEREVSDKLATALQRIAKLRIVEVDEILDDYVDVIAEVAAMRANNDQ